MKISPGIQKFNAQNISNGYYRPTKRPNAWVAEFDDKRPWLMLEWNERQHISKVVLSFDTDFDHAMESTLRGHPEDVMPFTVRNYKLCDENDNLIYHGQENHQTSNEIAFDTPVKTKRLIIEADHPLEHVPASVFGVRCYE